MKGCWVGSLSAALLNKAMRDWLTGFFTGDHAGFDGATKTRGGLRAELWAMTGRYSKAIADRRSSPATTTALVHSVQPLLFVPFLVRSARHSFAPRLRSILRGRTRVNSYSQCGKQMPSWSMSPPITVKFYLG